jgi:hypothetical protein
MRFLLYQLYSIQLTSFMNITMSLSYYKWEVYWTPKRLSASKVGLWRSMLTLALTFLTFIRKGPRHRLLDWLLWRTGTPAAWLTCGKDWDTGCLTGLWEGLGHPLHDWLVRRTGTRLHDWLVRRTGTPAAWLTCRKDGAPAAWLTCDCIHLLQASACIQY